MILFADHVNFKRENFPALYHYLDSNSLVYDYHESFIEEKKIWGEYSSDSFSGIEIDSEDRIYASEDEIAELYKHELQSAILRNSDWANTRFRSDSELNTYAKENFKEQKDGCRRAVIFWVRHWSQVFAEKKPTCGIVFGGNLIYSTAFMFVAKKLDVPVFVLEHFFTGNDWYMEQRYSPIPNNSILRSKSYVSKLVGNGASINDYEIWQKLNAGKNKNVKQPAYTSPDLRDYVLILGQVPSDFSITSRNNLEKNSIAFYKDLISYYLNESSESVVVKVHPYERRINSAGRTNTYDSLVSYRSTLSADYRNRVKIFEDFSLQGLINNCKYAVTINSQAGLEAIINGKQLVCFGNPFYANHGFTISLMSIGELSEVDMPAYLSEQQLSSFIRFMGATFRHLIGENEHQKVADLMSNLRLPRLKPEAKPIVSAIKVPDAAVSASMSTKSNALVTVKANAVRLVDQLSRTKRLCKKFKRDPKAYCLDSQHSLLRFIGKKVL